MNTATVDMEALGRNARQACRLMAASGTQARNRAPELTADLLEQRREAILQANAEDLQAARTAELSVAMLDRLELNADRVTAMAAGLRQVAALADPIGAIEGVRAQPSGIQVGRMRVPLGVIGIIYEARPGVTADAAALCLKSGNAVLLRGGSEALHSNLIISQCVRDGLEQAGLPADAVTVIPATDRAWSVQCWPCLHGSI